jgi:hypothetical protein
MMTKTFHFIATHKVTKEELYTVLPCIEDESESDRLKRIYGRCGTSDIDLEVRAYDILHNMAWKDKEPLIVCVLKKDDIRHLKYAGGLGEDFDLQHFLDHRPRRVKLGLPCILWFDGGYGESGASDWSQMKEMAAKADLLVYNPNLFKGTHPNSITWSKELIGGFNWDTESHPDSKYWKYLMCGFYTGTIDKESMLNLDLEDFNLTRLHRPHWKPSYFKYQPL